MILHEALMAYDAKVVGLHAPIKVRVTKEIGGKKVSRIIDATVGRLIFNDPIPQDLGYVDRSDSGQAVRPGNRLPGQARSSSETSSTAASVCMAPPVPPRCWTASRHRVYKYSTRSGLTVAVVDAVIPPEKADIIAEADKKVLDIRRQYDRGFISDDVRYERVVKTWNEATQKVRDALQETFKSDNPIYMMADSGARGSMDQIRQLAGMRGLIANTSGRSIEIPIKSNYREGLNILEYFNSSRGARKGLADTALRTADSGYLTRRLVDVSQDVIIRMKDCGTHEGIMVQSIMDNGRVIEDLSERLFGRYLADDIYHPETGELLVSRDKMMDENDAKKIIDAGYHRGQDPFHR